MMYSCHGLMLARQMCACVAEGARAHGLPHLVIFSLSTILSALPSLPSYPQFLGRLFGREARGESRDATNLGARWLRGVRHNPVSPVHHSLTVFGDHSRTLAS